MTTDLIYYQKKTLRTAGTADEPWFCAADVCDILGIQNPSQAVRSHPENELKVYAVDRPSRGPQKVIFVNEPGLYRLIFASRRPEAEALKTAVFTDVLPSLRKHGFYRAPRTDLPPELLALPAGRQERILREEALMREIEAAPWRSRRQTIARISERHHGERGYNPQSLYRRFRVWLESGRLWTALDRYRTLRRDARPD